MLTRLGFNRSFRALFWEVFFPFIGAVVFLYFIFFIFQSFRLSDLLIVKRIPFVIFLKLMGFMMISLLPWILPIALLVGVLVGFSRISLESEQVAWRASGLRDWQMLLPAGFLGLMVAITVYQTVSQVAPHSEYGFKKTLLKVANSRAVATFQEGTFTTGFFDLLIYADKVDYVNNQLERVFIYDERNPQSPVTITAERGEMIQVESKKELEISNLLKLYRGSIQQTEGVDKNNFKTLNFNEYQIYLKFEPEQETGSTVKPRMMVSSELKNEWKKVSSELPQLQQDSELFKERSRWLRKLQTEWWKRINISLTALIFVALGMVLGSLKTRSPKSTAILTAIGVVVGYWFLLGYVTSQSQDGAWPTAFAMLLPCGLVALLTLILYQKQRF
jgi:lipopolysaccharide export system permease protein